MNILMLLMIMMMMVRRRRGEGGEGGGGGKEEKEEEEDIEEKPSPSKSTDISRLRNLRRGNRSNCHEEQRSNDITQFCCRRLMENRS
jgi:hypothetical protein